jgi:hypothetical protein
MLPLRVDLSANRNSVGYFVEDRAALLPSPFYLLFSSCLVTRKLRATPSSLVPVGFHPGCSLAANRFPALRRAARSGPLYVSALFKFFKGTEEPLMAAPAIISFLSLSLSFSLSNSRWR